MPSEVPAPDFSGALAGPRGILLYLYSYEKKYGSPTGALVPIRKLFAICSFAALPVILSLQLYFFFVLYGTVEHLDQGAFGSWSCAHLMDRPLPDLHPPGWAYYQPLAITVDRGIRILKPYGSSSLTLVV